MSLTLSFDLRANTASGSVLNTTTVNLKWHAAGVVTDLGNFTSAPATVSGDALWTTHVVSVDSVYNSGDVNRLEVTRVSGDNSHVRNVWVETISGDVSGAALWHHFTLGPTVYEEQPTLFYRADPARSAKVSTTSGASTTRLSVTLEPGRTYLVQAWVRAVPGDGGATRTADLEMQSTATSTQYVLQDFTYFDTASWRKLEGLFTCPSGETSFDVLIQGNAGVFLPGGWHHYLADWSVAPTKNDLFTLIGTLGPSSDGGTWTMLDLFTVYPNPPQVPVFQVAAGRVHNDLGTAEQSGAYRDLGSPACDISFVYYHGSDGRARFFWACDPNDATCYAYVPWRSGNAVITRYHRRGALEIKDFNDGFGSSIGLPPSGTTVRIVHDGFGRIQVYWNGVLKHDVVDPEAATPLTGTWAGFGLGPFSGYGDELGGFSGYNYNRDLGEFPLGFPYALDVEDGALLGLPIINDGGTLPGSAFYAEHGDTVDPSTYNYSVNWATKTPGTHVTDYDGWVDTGALWLCDGQGAVMSGYDSSSHPPFGTSLFSMLGKNWYPEIRPDGFREAPHHNIDMGMSTAGSRGMGLIGPIWGWNSWSDFFFAVNGGHSLPSGPGVYRVQGGVPTFLGSLDANSLGGTIQVRHDFQTGDLHVWSTDYFMGGVHNYYGNHPHTVGRGYSGWMGDTPGVGIFGDTTWCTSWSNIFNPGLIGYKRQYSMQDLEVVPSDPLAWYFLSKNLVGWVVGAIGMG